MLWIQSIFCCVERCSFSLLYIESSALNKWNRTVIQWQSNSEATYICIIGGWFWNDMDHVQILDSIHILWRMQILISFMSAQYGLHSTGWGLLIIPSFLSFLHWMYFQSKYRIILIIDRLLFDVVRVIQTQHIGQYFQIYVYNIYIPKYSDLLCLICIRQYCFIFSYSLIAL